MQKYFRYKAQRAKVSKNVSVSAYHRLGLVSDSRLNVSVSISWKVVRSRSRSRTGSQTSRSRLGPQRLVYIPAVPPKLDFSIHPQLVGVCMQSVLALAVCTPYTL